MSADLLLSASFLSPAPFAGAFTLGVPLGEEAEYVVEFRPIPGAGFLQTHGDFVAGVQHYDHALAVVSEGQSAASLNGAIKWCHRRYFTKRTSPKLACAIRDQRLTTRRLKGNK